MGVAALGHRPGQSTGPAPQSPVLAVTKAVASAVSGLYSESMTTTQTDDPAWGSFLRRLGAALSPQWLSALLDLAAAIGRRLTAKPEGLYEILAYESTLELADPQGKRATVSKRQRISFLQNDIAAFQDIVYGDGDIFAGYDVAPGVAADYYRDGDRWHVLISLRATKNRGDEEEFLLTRTITEGFTREEEWWEVELRHPTHWLRLTLVFPQDRSCRRASLTQRSTRRTWILGPEHLSTRPDGRQELRWETRNVRPLEVFTVRWQW